MAGSGAGVGIVVVALGEVGAVLEKQAESALAEFVVVALQIVTAKLIDDDHHDQLGMGVVGRCGTYWRAHAKQNGDQRGQRRGMKPTARRRRSGEGSHCEVSLHSETSYAKRGQGMGGSPILATRWRNS